MSIIHQFECEQNILVTTCYYFARFSPSGEKIRSKPQLVRLLGEGFDLSCFDFRSGKILQSAIRKSKRHKGGSYDYSRGMYTRSRLPMAERVGCGTPCLLGSLGVQEVVGSRPGRGNSKESFFHKKI